MGKIRSSFGLPDILAVKEDRQQLVTPDRRATFSPCDILSVYMEGGPRYRLDHCTYECTPPIAILIPRGTLDHDQQVGRINGIYVLFRSHGLLQKAPGKTNHVVVSLGHQRVLAPFFKQVSSADAERIVALLREIASIGTRGFTGQLRCAALLFHALAEYCEAGTPTEREGIHREAWRLRDIIETRAFENLSLDALYDELELSASHAEKLFKAAFHVAPVTYRLQLRMKKARACLVSSQRNVSEVARAVGFTDPLYFSRLFRKTFGTAPSALIRDFSIRRKQTGE